MNGLEAAPNEILEREHTLWLKNRKCLVPGCREPSEPHHLRGKNLGGGMGLKPPFLSRVPLCRGHHEQLHYRGVRFFETEYGLDLQRELIFCLWRFIQFTWRMIIALAEEVRGQP